MDKNKFKIELKKYPKKKFYLSIKDNKLYLGFVIEEPLKINRRIDLKELAEEYICDRCNFGKKFFEKNNEKIKYNKNTSYYNELISFLLESLIKSNTLKKVILNNKIIYNKLEKYIICNKEYFIYKHDNRYLLLKEEINNNLYFIDINNICLLVDKNCLSIIELLHLKYNVKLNIEDIVFKVFDAEFFIENNKLSIKTKNYLNENESFIIFDRQKYNLNYIERNKFLETFSIDLTDVINNNSFKISIDEILDFCNEKDLETIESLNKILIDFSLKLDKLKREKLEEIEEKYNSLICNSIQNNYSIVINKDCNLGKKIIDNKNNNNYKLLKENLEPGVKNYTLKLLSSIIKEKDSEIYISNYIDSIEVENLAFFIEINLNSLDGELDYNFNLFKLLKEDEKYNYFYPFLLGNIYLSSKNSNICWNNNKPTLYYDEENKTNIFNLDNIFELYINKIFSFELFSHLEYPLLIKENPKYKSIQEYLNNQKFLTNHLEEQSSPHKLNPILKDSEIIYIDNLIESLYIKIDVNNKNLNVKTYKNNTLEKNIDFKLLIKKKLYTF